MSDDPVVRIGIAVLAVVLGVAWAVGVVAGVWVSIESGPDPDWVTSDGMKYFMPGLTALVGGVVAVAFGVKANADPPAPTPPVATLAGILEAKSTSESSSRLWIARLYFVLYLALGLVAVVTWILKEAETVEFVRTLAPAWGGLVIPVVGSWVSQPKA